MCRNLRYIIIYSCALELCTIIHRKKLLKLTCIANTSFIVQDLTLNRPHFAKTHLWAFYGVFCAFSVISNLSLNLHTCYNIIWWILCVQDFILTSCHFKWQAFRCLCILGVPIFFLYTPEYIIKKVTDQIWFKLTNSFFMLIVINTRIFERPQ